MGLGDTAKSNWKQWDTAKWQLYNTISLLFIAAKYSCLNVIKFLKFHLFLLMMRHYMEIKVSFIIELIWSLFSMQLKLTSESVFLVWFSLFNHYLQSYKNTLWDNTIQGIYFFKVHVNKNCISPLIVIFVVQYDIYFKAYYNVY